MILNFMVYFPGQKKEETLFREKIIKGLMQESKTPSIYIPYCADLNWVNALMITQPEMIPKIHSIRRDAKDRWKVGMAIDFFINARTKRAHLFAPRIQVKSLQKISFSWKENKVGHIYDQPTDRSCIIEIDGKFFGDAYFYQGKLISQTERIKDLAINDGFNTIEEFFLWFKEDFSGKIIHWSNLKY